MQDSISKFVGTLDAKGRNMKEKDKKNNERQGIKTAVNIMSAAFILIFLTLLGLLIYKKNYMSRYTSAAVPDNLITAEKAPCNDNIIKPEQSQEHICTEEAVRPAETSESAEKPEVHTACPNDSDANISDPDEKNDEQNTQQSQTGQNTSEQEQSAEHIRKKEKAEVLNIYKNHPDDNTPFNVVNMFPGDTQEEYYCVRVSHKGSITVYFHAAVRPGFEKLAEVMQCRVELLTTGETLYEGLMRDMPEKLSHILPTENDNELYYRITAFLDTSVGNEYQNKELIADFNWWVDDEGGLLPPGTGGVSYVWLGVFMIAAAACIVIIACLIRKRKKEEHNAA